MAEASVSHDFIVKQSNVPFYTQQKPPDVIISDAAKSNSNVSKSHTGGNSSVIKQDGDIDKELETNQTECTGSDGCLQTDTRSESRSSNCKKKKKKKKMKDS